MPQPIHRSAVLTGGGDCPGLNAVIRAMVKTAINEYTWDVLGIEDGFERIEKARGASLDEIERITVGVLDEN